MQVPQQKWRQSHSSAVVNTQFVCAIVSCMFIIRATVGYLNVASESPVLVTSGANPWCRRWALRNAAAIDWHHTPVPKKGPLPMHKVGFMRTGPRCIYNYIYILHASVLCCLLLLPAWIPWAGSHVKRWPPKALGKVFPQRFRREKKTSNHCPLNGCWEVRRFFFLRVFWGVFFGGLHRQRRKCLFFFRSFVSPGFG